MKIFASLLHKVHIVRQTREEDIAVCGKEVADRIKIYQHDWSGGGPGACR